MSREEFPKRMICFLLSLLFHGGLIYLAMSEKMTYRIYPEKVRVTDVFIAPMEKLSLPPIGGVENLGPVEDPTESGLPRRSRPSRVVGTQEAEWGVGLEGPDVPETKGSALPGIRQGGGQVPLTQSFSMTPSLETRLNLSPFTEEREKSGEDRGTGRSRAVTDFRKYVFPDYSFSGPGREGRPAGAQGTVRRFTQGRASGSFRVPGYDISPWANEIVNRIQKNWVLSAEEAVGVAGGEVGIAVVIEKNGEISSSEIVIPSRVAFFDEAALKAIRMSGPFPVLPPDFPGKNLEAFFAFQYGY